MLLKQVNSILRKSFVIYRYIENNFRRFGMYRNCNKIIPDLLHDKLQNFTKYYAERLASVKAIKKSNIEVKSLENLIFRLHSFSSNHAYTIFLGGKMTMPQFNCNNWGKNVMARKHISAIMDHCECASWLSFSEKYRQSPFLRLDNTVVNEDGIANQLIDNSMLENIIEESHFKETEYTELRKHIFMKRSKASTCRELLNQIRNLFL